MCAARRQRRRWAPKRLNRDYCYRAEHVIRQMKNVQTIQNPISPYFSNKASIDWNELKMDQRQPQLSPRSEAQSIVDDIWNIMYGVDHKFIEEILIAGVRACWNTSLPKRCLCSVYTLSTPSLFLAFDTWWFRWSCTLARKGTLGVLNLWMRHSAEGKLWAR